MLEGEQSEEAYSGRALIRRIDSKDATLLLRTIIDFGVYHWLSISDGLLRALQPLN